MSSVLSVAAASVQVAVLLLLVAAGVWAYRRFRLPSVPWLLAYLLLRAALAVPAGLAAKGVVDRASAAGLGPAGPAVTLGELVASVAYVEMILGSVAQGLVAWFVLSELAFAYGRSGSADAVPAAVTLPRRHAPAVGIPLLACAAALPAFWLALSVAGT